jgi:hypothetical protein
MVAQMAQEFRGTRFSLTASNSSEFPRALDEKHGLLSYMCCEALGMLHAWLAEWIAVETEVVSFRAVLQTAVRKRIAAEALLYNCPPFINIIAHIAILCRLQLSQ